MSLFTGAFNRLLKSSTTPSADANGTKTSLKASSQQEKQEISESHSSDISDISKSKGDQEQYEEEEEEEEEEKEVVDDEEEEEEEEEVEDELEESKVEDEEEDYEHEEKEIKSNGSNDEESEEERTTKKSVKVSSTKQKTKKTKKSSDATSNLDSNNKLPELSSLHISTHEQTPREIIMDVVENKISFDTRLLDTQDVCLSLIPALTAHHYVFVLVYRHAIDQDFEKMTRALLEDAKETVSWFKSLPSAHIQLQALDYQMILVNECIELQQHDDTKGEQEDKDSIPDKLLTVCNKLECIAPHLCHIPFVPFNYNKYTFGRALTRSKNSQPAFPLRATWVTDYTEAVTRLQAVKNTVPCGCSDKKCTMESPVCGILFPTSVERKFYQIVRTQGQQAFLNEYEPEDSEFAMYEAFSAWQKLRILEEELLAIDLTLDKHPLLLHEYAAWLTRDVLLQMYEVQQSICMEYRSIDDFMEESLMRRLREFAGNSLMDDLQTSRQEMEALVKQVNELSQTDHVLSLRKYMKEEQTQKDRKELEERLTIQLNSDIDEMSTAFRETQTSVRGRELEYEQLRQQNENARLLKLETLEKGLAIDLETLAKEYERNQDKLRKQFRHQQQLIIQDIDVSLHHQQGELLHMKKDLDKLKNELDDKVALRTNAHKKMLHEALLQLDKRAKENLANAKVEIEKECIEKKADLRKLQQAMPAIPNRTINKVMSFIKDKTIISTLEDKMAMTQVEKHLKEIVTLNGYKV